MSQPWYIAPIRLDLSSTYIVQFINIPYATGFSPGTFHLRVKSTRWLRNLPEYIYTGDQQKEDHSGSLPSSVFVGVRKKSKHPLGPPSDWLYATFVRP
jgi:hypothetical protein